MAVTLWSTTVSTKFINIFIPLPTQHTHFPSFPNNGYVLSHKWPMVRWRRSRLCSGMNRRMVILKKATQLPYCRLSEMSERVISCALQPWLIRKLSLLFPEKNKTIYHCYVNKDILGTQDIARPVNCIHKAVVVCKKPQAVEPLQQSTHPLHSSLFG